MRASLWPPSPSSCSDPSPARARLQRAHSDHSRASVSAVDWDAVTVAAAFVLGAIAGTAGTIAVMRTIVRYLKRGE
jgi:hypothetical protein